MTIRKHLVFIGFPNSGKSFFGKKISEQLEVPFLDLDQSWVDGFEEVTHLSHKKVIRSRWESIYNFFHSLWLHRNLRKLYHHPPSIINMGGAVIYDDYAMQKVKESCLIIYLSVDFEELNRRRDFSTKGIHTGQGRTYQEEYEYRKPLYEKYGQYTLQETLSWKNDLQG
jgi:shikimate kinase